MKGYGPVPSTAISLGAVIALLITVPMSGQAPAGRLGAATTLTDWVVPRTPWDHPDLQGIWTTDDEVSVPVERPVELGKRLELTREEVSARAARRRAGLERASGGPLHWLEYGYTPSTRTSLHRRPAQRTYSTSDLRWRAALEEPKPRERGRRAVSRSGGSRSAGSMHYARASQHLLPQYL